MYGILYYFPPVRGEEEHDIFKEDDIKAQSLRSPFVNVTSTDREALVAKYEVDESIHTVVIADWYGNQLQKYEAKKKTSRLPAAAIVAISIERAITQGQLTDQLDPHHLAQQMAAARSETRRSSAPARASRS